MTLTSTHTESAPQNTGREWALVDVETSGLRPGSHRVLSVAVMTLDPQGRWAEEFSTLLNPGCDPGPVHIHGLTPQRLRGAPTFDQVAPRIGAMLKNRVLVAHNAQFDYDFLAHEFAHARSWLPVSQRLCTLALNRRLAPPTEDLRLGTLAAHYGVPHGRAHDALEDVRALAGVLRASLTEASRLELPLPLVSCPPRQSTSFRPRVPKTRCAYRSPGRLSAGEPLMQGMKVAFTGETRVSREELTARAVEAGLNVMTSVSRHTSVLVSNAPGADTAKTRLAREADVPVIDEAAFVRLLGQVRPGIPHSAGPAETGTREARPPRRSPSSEQPLRLRRVLVLGGSHQQAAAARTRVVTLGGAAAVNLSASVTDVLALQWAESDRRMTRIRTLGLPIRDVAWLDAPSLPAPPEEAVPDVQRSSLVLPRGGVADLSGTTEEASSWTLTASWAQQTTCDVDVVAFRLDEEEQVTCDEDFVFYGVAESPDGTMRLSTDGPSEQAMVLDIGTQPQAVRKIVVAAAIDGTATFGDVGAVEIEAATGRSAGTFARATLDAATTERTLLLAEFYRRGAGWRMRAVGQGYDHGLASLARGFGVDVEEA
ncbi:TerD family protein [Streptomyces sp. NPDC048172]|uniref:TerD family protein n=1 Tax=Streptomyces sp. NPDC048172 TaxID=3365505 RepID=UPI00372066B9